MSDTLQERESGATATDYCNECKGRPHAPWCSEFEPPGTEANQLLPDGIGSISAGNEHQPAARSGGDEWEYIETRYGAEAKAGNFIIRLHWTGLADIEDARGTIQQIVTEHNQHQSLVAERERLRDILRKTLKAIEVIDFSNCREGAYDSIPWSEIEEAVNEQRSTSE